MQYWGPTACDFLPDRWFSPEIKDILAAGAFRTFERGPRACIGQELAMIEIKVILALICREFDFEKVGFDGITQEEVYDVSAPKS
jgi:cytochrome P450